MNVALVIFLILCVLCAILLLFALVFGARQDRYKSSIREERDDAPAVHRSDP